MNCRVFEGGSAPEWDERASKYAQVLQTFEWGQVKASSGWEALRVGFRSGGAASILKRKLPYINKCFFYVPRGPMIDFSDAEQVKGFVSSVKELAKEHGALFLRMDPEVPEDDRTVLELLKAQGFIRAKKEIQPRSTYLVDLTRPLEDIKASFEPKFRYNINVALKHGISVDQGIGDKAVTDFYDIYKETCSRQTFIIHPLSYYQKINELINKKGMGTIFTAYKDGIPVAGVYVFLFGGRAWYMYGCSSNKYRNMMPNNLIHWEIIKWAKQKGAAVYDLWGIPSNPTDAHPLWGVYRFKKGFGGKLVKFIGAYDLPFNKVLYGVFDNGIIFYQNAVRFMKKGTISDSLGE